MNQDNQPLVVRDYPLTLWFIGLMILGFGIYSFYRTPGEWIFPAIACGIALLFIILPTISIVKADRGLGTLTITNVGLLQRSVRAIPIADIAAIDLQRSSSSSSRRGRSATYRIVVQAKDSQVIPFRSYYSSGFLSQQAKVKRLREFLGVGGMDMSLAGVMKAASAVAQQEFRKEQESITGSQAVEHSTDGVRWKLETTAVGGTPVSRWFSPDFKWDGRFLFLAQKVPGQSSSGWLMSMMGKTLLSTSMGGYGFTGELAPGMDTAGPFTPLDPQLEPHFFAFTSDPAGAGRILNARALPPLAAWAQKYSAKQVSRGSGYQLAVLFCPQGVYLAMLGLTNPEFLQEIAALGAELIKAQR